jgi:hypothetical protein
MTPDGPSRASGPGSQEDASSVRRRRAERSRGVQWRHVGRRAAKPLAILAVLLLVAVVVWGASRLPSRPSPAKEPFRHWHAGFEIWINGTQLDLHKCEFDLDGCNGIRGTDYAAGHLHHNEALRYMLHIEHPVKLGNLTLKNFADHLGFQLTNTSLRLDTRAYHGETYANNATHTWQLWVASCVVQPPHWTRVVDLPGYPPQQHDRFLLTYTDRPFEELGAEIEHIPTSAEMFNAGGGQCPRALTTVTSGATTTLT